MLPLHKLTLPPQLSPAIASPCLSEIKVHSYHAMTRATLATTIMCMTESAMPSMVTLKTHQCMVMVTMLTVAATTTTSHTTLVASATIAHSMVQHGTALKTLTAAVTTIICRFPFDTDTDTANSHNTDNHGCDTELGTPTIASCMMLAASAAAPFTVQHRAVALPYSTTILGWFFQAAHTVRTVMGWGRGGG